MTGRAAVLAAYLRSRRRRFADRDALEAWQAARLRRVLDQAPTRYPYYRGLAPRRLTDLPVIDKSVVVAHFEALNDRGLDLARCLAAPPPVLRELAEAHLAGDLPIAPTRIFSVAEVLDPRDRRAVEHAFGIRVDEIYQATEGFLRQGSGARGAGGGRLPGGADRPADRPPRGRTSRRVARCGPLARRRDRRGGLRRTCGGTHRDHERRAPGQAATRRQAVPCAAARWRLTADSTAPTGS